MFLLDTNACMRILNGSCPALVARLRSQSPATVRLSSVVRAELTYGALKSARPSENLRLLERFCDPFTSLPFDDSCTHHYGTIRSELERTGRPIGPNDLMIAATALAHGLTLVTHDVGEFSRVTGLSVEDWEAPPPGN